MGIFEKIGIYVLGAVCLVLIVTILSCMLGCMRPKETIQEGKDNKSEVNETATSTTTGAAFASKTNNDNSQTDNRIDNGINFELSSGCSGGACPIPLATGNNSGPPNNEVASKIAVQSAVLAQLRDDVGRSLSNQAVAGTEIIKARAEAEALKISAKMDVWKTVVYVGGAACIIICLLCLLLPSPLNRKAAATNG